MSIEILLVIAALPVFLLCKYVYDKDKDKEPKKLLTRLFIFGILSIIPILIFEVIIDKFFNIENTKELYKMFISVFVGIGLIEEGSKWLITYISIYNDKEFNHIYDAIVYCVFASLGFALIENVLYIIGGGVGVGILRAFTSIPSHACDGIIMGYFLGKAKQEEINNNQSNSNKYMLLSLLTPIIVHTIYDFLIMSANLLLILSFFQYVIFIYVICFLLVKKVSLVSYNFDGNNLEIKNEKIQKQISGKSFAFSTLITLTISMIIGLFYFI